MQGQTPERVSRTVAVRRGGAPATAPLCRASFRLTPAATWLIVCDVPLRNKPR